MNFSFLWKVLLINIILSISYHFTIHMPSNFKINHKTCNYEICFHFYNSYRKLLNNFLQYGVTKGHFHANIQHTLNIIPHTPLACSYQCPHSHSSPLSSRKVCIDFTVIIYTWVYTSITFLRTGRIRKEALNNNFYSLSNMSLIGYNGIHQHSDMNLGSTEYGQSLCRYWYYQIYRPLWFGEFNMILKTNKNWRYSQFGISIIIIYIC